MDFEPCFKVSNLLSVHPKSIKLCQITTLNVIFHVVVPVYRLVTRLVKMWNSPTSLHNFGMAYWRFVCYAYREKERNGISHLNCGRTYNYCVFTLNYISWYCVCFCINNRTVSIKRHTFSLSDNNSESSNPSKRLPSQIQCLHSRYVRNFEGLDGCRKFWKESLRDTKILFC